MQTGISRKKTVLADLGLVYAAAIWGSTFFIVKGALDGIDPIVMVAYRFLIAGLVMVPFLLWTKRKLFEGLGRAFFLSIILWALYASQTLGLKYTTASNSGFITGLFVFFTPVFLYVIFKRRPTVMEIVASAVSLAGLWILTGGMEEINVGDALTLIAAMTYALHVLYSDKYMKMRIDPYVISCQQFIMVGILSLVTAAVAGLDFVVYTREALYATIFLALFPSLSAFLIQMLAQRITSPLKVSLIFALEPVFAALFAWTLGGEEFIMHRATGGLLIFFALVLSGLPVGKARPKPIES